MKRIFLPLISLVFLACSDSEDYEPSRPEGFQGVVESSGSVPLSEIVFTLDLVVEDSMYLLADSLFSLEIYLNNREWGQFTSTPVDISAFDFSSREESLLSSEPVRYLFVTNDQSGVQSLQTAGDYSLALREFLSLQPGDYVAELRYVSWVNAQGILERRSIRDLIPFTLSPEVNSLYIGNFTSTLKL